MPPRSQEIHAEKGRMPQIPHVCPRQCPRETYSIQLRLAGGKMKGNYRKKRILRLHVHLPQEGVAAEVEAEGVAEETIILAKIQPKHKIKSIRSMKIT
jgi:hypothetical protein